MQKYFIFSNNLSNIGGAQLYILRKAKWLHLNNYEVVIVTAKKNPLLLEGFNSFNIIELSELNYPPNIFSNKNLNNIIEQILLESNLVNYKKTVYVESHQTSPALWAELFAKRVNANNIVYAIGAMNLKRKTYKNFFVDKLTNDLFLGCNKSYINKYFSSVKLEKRYNNNYFNIPFDKNEIEKSNFSRDNEKSYDLNILTISRIEKTYLIDTIKQISDFSKSHPNISIKYEIYVDSSFGEKHEELKKMIDTKLTPNLIIYLRGPIVPLNDGIFKNQDVYLGMGTSIINSSAMGLPSLVIGNRDNMYYGYFGYDCFEFGGGFDEKTYTFSQVISALLDDKENFKKKLGEAAYKHFINNYENNLVNESFLEFVKKHNKAIYHSNIKINDIMDIRDFVDYILVSIFGVQKSLKLRTQINNLYLRILSYI